MKKIMALGAFAALVALAALCIAAVNVDITDFTKQNGGSTGDSCTVAPDTSDWEVLDEDITHCHIVFWADSLTSYLVQVSVDGTHLATAVALDSVAIGASEATTDLGATWAGQAIRVIQDNLSAAGAASGNARLITSNR